MELIKVVDDQTYVFKIQRRKRQKRIIFHGITPKEFKITTPYQMSKKAIEKAIEQNLDEVLNLKIRQDYRMQYKIGNAISCFEETVIISDVAIDEPYILVRPDKAKEDVIKHLKLLLNTYVNRLIDKYHSLDSSLNLNDVTFTLKYLKSKYGSCQPNKRKIILNMELVHYPVAFLEYIFAHEIAHLKHPNHSRDFYQYLEQLYPKSKQQKKVLTKFHETLIYQGFDALINVTNSA